MANSEKTVRRAPSSAARRLAATIFFNITGEVTDGWIDLSQRDLHSYSLIPGVDWAELRVVLAQG